MLIEVKKKILDKKIFSFDPSMSPILVESAFGGFGIYKMKNVLNNVNKYKGTQSIEVISKDEKKIKLKYQKCEHVNFNQGLAEQNLNLYILPYLINRGHEKQFFLPEVAINLIIKD